MKKIIISVTLTLLAIIAYGQNQVFYYYEGNKVYLTEQKELVLIHLKKGADKSKVQQLILTDLNFLLPKRQKDKPLSEYIVLESSLGLLPTNPSLLRYLNSEEVLSATFMLRYGNQTNQGITDEFIVKLKPSTTIEQLQSLITLNNVRIVKDNDFVKNQYLLSVNKTASLNAIQAANIFFEPCD